MPGKETEVILKTYAHEDIWGRVSTANNSVQIVKIDGKNFSGTAEQPLGPISEVFV